MAQTRQCISMYRSLIRELRKRSTSSTSPRNEAVFSNLRSIFSKPPRDQAMFQRDISNATLFLKSQREYRILIDRYNPLVDLTAEERIHATARRVGLDLPETHKPE